MIHVHIKVWKVLTQLRTREIDHKTDFLYQKGNFYKSEARDPSGEGKYGFDLRRKQRVQSPVQKAGA